MKRSAFLGLALTAVAAGGAKAQGLTMQMSNGWSFSFAGNVNAFAVYSHGDVSTPGAIAFGQVSTDRATRLRTGLLPAFATFEARGKEAGLDLGVHFGFAPQIQSASLHDQFGAQIDMRQVYLTAGGSWGQILAGREIGLYQRQNILTDMTLFGVGASGGVVGAGGTTLGRIGFGYLYPNFNAQLTYSTPAGKPGQLSVGVFDPSIVCSDAGCDAPAGAFTGTRAPRVEAELTWTASFGGGGGGAAGAPAASSNKFMLWVNGLYQNTKATAVGDVSPNPSVNSAGGGAGVKLDFAGLSIVGSGYYATGLGTTLMFGQGGGAIDPVADERNSYGYIGQVTFTPVGSKVTFGGSFGESRLKTTDADPPDAANPLVEYNRLIVGMITFQATKALKWVNEFDYAEAKAFSDAKTKSYQGATGLMLFF
jgi:hypothetical protein